MKQSFVAEAIEIQPSLVSIVAKRLRDEIEQRRFPLGTAFPTDAELAKGFGVSRTVVREAVSSLREAGLISTQRGRGSIVIAYTASPGFRISSEELESGKRLLHLYEFRSLIETEAAGLAAQRRTEADVQRIYDALQDGRSIGSFDKAIAADIDFHVAIAEAARNEYFQRIMATIRTATTARALMRFETDRESYVELYRTVLQKEHLDIADAIRDGHPSKARQLLKRHLGGRRYKALLKSALEQMDE